MTLKRRIINVILVVVITLFLVFILCANLLVHLLIFTRKKLKAIGLVDKVHTNFDRKIDSIRSLISFTV